MLGETGDLAGGGAAVPIVGIAIITDFIARDDAWKGGRAAPWAILIGPEGGFSESERNRFAELRFAHA
ncbi:MAG: 16S rRNA (uracil(1498)-N(3))-methyltransferase, partial [Nannocystaceae bacterium]